MVDPNSADDFFASFEEGEKMHVDTAPQHLIDEVKAHLARAINPTKKLDKILEEMGPEMDKLEDRVRANSDDTAPAHLFSPFDILRRNRTNSFRNHHRNLEQLAAGGTPKAGMKPFQFAVALSSRVDWEKPDGEAVFNPQYNVVTFADDFDPKSQFDLFIACHELQHVRQLHEMLHAIGPQQYFQIFTPKHENFFPHFEVEAWALQLEGIDRYLGRALSRDAAQPITDARVAQFLEALNAKPERAALAKSLMQGAQLFFPHGIKNGRVPAAFSTPLMQTYVQGKRSLVFNKHSGVQPMDPSDTGEVIQ